MAKRSIAILQHERQRAIRRDYMVAEYANFWREDGHDVLFLFGTREFVPADVLIVHVDLSVVPDEYLEFAKRYPVVLNGAVKDIRKATYSRLLVKPGDGYEGPVIIKSNYNYAGLPERSLRLVDPAFARSHVGFRNPFDYRVAGSPRRVPQFVWNDEALIVERFQPEFDGALYYMRAMVFVGDRVSCARMGSKRRIVNGSTQEFIEDVEPHPDILAARDEFGFQYGKFDYVMHAGRPVLLDINKTVGGPPPSTDPKILAGRRHRAEGLYSFFR